VIYLLDTDIFTLTHQRRFGLRERVAAVAGPDLVAVSVMTKVEVLLGRLDAVRKAATSEDIIRMQDRLAQSETFLGAFPMLPFNPAAGVFFDRFRTGKPVGKMDRGDLLVACIALAHAATLVTRNTKGFAHVPGLKLDNWAD